MENASLKLLLGLITAFMLSNTQHAMAQESGDAGSASASNDSGATFVAGHPFSAIKYARRVRVLPGGKQQFLGNERYPRRVARDADGRLMIQEIDSDNLPSECDKLTVVVPPVCPAWDVFVIDPVARMAIHWVEGEIAGHVALQMPLSQVLFDQAAHTTSDIPDPAPNFTAEDGEVRTVDLGDKEIDGVPAHGARTTLRYARVESGRSIDVIRIHEVWIAAEMKLIVRVIDGDPNGEETVWGLEKISLEPSPSLFRPPQDYEVQRSTTDRWAIHDLEYLESWFAQ
jgi:hypothetical protein